MISLKDNNCVAQAIFYKCCILAGNKLYYEKTKIVKLEEIDGGLITYRNIESYRALTTAQMCKIIFCMLSQPGIMKIWCVLEQSMQVNISECLDNYFRVILGCHTDCVCMYVYLHQQPSYISSS